MLPDNHLRLQGHGGAWGELVCCSRPDAGGGANVPQRSRAHCRRRASSWALPFPQVTAFISNLDEATVNCGAAEPRTIHLSSSSGSGSGGGGGGPGGGGGGAAAVGCAGPSSSGGGGSSSSSAAAAPSHLLRLRAGGEAQVARRGWGWRQSRAAWEEAVRRENRVERLVARSNPAAAERRLMQRLLVARLEPVAFKGCSGAARRASSWRAYRRPAGSRGGSRRMPLLPLSQRATVRPVAPALSRTPRPQPIAPCAAPPCPAPAGANSLFEALSLALWGTPLCALPLRAAAVTYAAEHPREYRCFLGDDWEAYLG